MVIGTSTVHTNLELAEGADCLSTVRLHAQVVAEFMGIEGRIHIKRAHKHICGLVVGKLGGPVWELVRGFRLVEVIHSLA